MHLDAADIILRLSKIERNLEKSMMMAQEALDICRKLLDINQMENYGKCLHYKVPGDYLLLDALTYLAHIYTALLGNHEKAIELYEEALRCAVNSFEERCEKFFEISKAYYNLGDHVKAKEMVQKMLREFRLSSFDKYEEDYRTYNTKDAIILWAQIEGQLAGHTKAMELCKLALAEYKFRRKDQADILLYMSKEYYSLNDYVKAMDLGQTAMAICMKKKGLGFNCKLTIQVRDHVDLVQRKKTEAEMHPALYRPGGPEKAQRRFDGCKTGGVLY